MRRATHDRRAHPADCLTDTAPVDWPLTAEDVEPVPPPRLPLSTWSVWAALAGGFAAVGLAIWTVTL